MSVNNKQMATFLLGAAAAFGAYKYMNMSDEEKEKMAASLKEKANKMKDQAVAAEDKAMDYFNELKTKGTDTFKEHMPKVEEFFNSLFGGAQAKATAQADTGYQGDAQAGPNSSNNNNDNSFSAASNAGF
jgi:hypothetical protein